MSQRLSDEAVADIREKVAAGAPKAVIAAAYCSSVRPLNRIVAGESRLPLSESVEDGAALAAVEEFFRALPRPCGSRLGGVAPNVGGEAGSGARF